MTSNLTHILYINVIAEFNIDGGYTEPKELLSYNQNSTDDNVLQLHKEESAASYSTDVQVIEEFYEKNTSIVLGNVVREANDPDSFSKPPSVQKEKMYSFRCPLCSYHTYNKEFSRVHLEAHLISKSNTEKSSFTEFDSGDYIQDEKMYMCHNCKFKTRQKDLLSIHMLTHSGSRLYRCSRCRYRSRSTIELIDHYKIHFGTLNRCTKCDFQTEHEGEFREHSLVHSGGDRSSTEPIEYYKVHARTLNRCMKCDFQTEHEGKFREHLLIHSGTKLFKCLLCPYESDVERNLTRHQVVHSESKMHQCPYCSFETNYKDYLKKHHLRKHVEDLLSCPECYYETNDKDSFKKHLKIHS